MGFIADIYDVKHTTPLMTDKYHFTTAYAYWLEGRADNPAVFYMFGRKTAQGAGYSVAGGLEGVIDVVKRWQEHGFTDEDLDFLRAQTMPGGRRTFPEPFIEYLKTMEFKLKIDAAPEGTVFFPQEPVLRVEGPIAQVKMLESVALCLINGHSGYITQAAHQDDAVREELDNGSPRGAASVQGLRRGPGLGAAIEASRSLGAGGYTSSSTGTAALVFGQNFAGTMDHAWVMTHRAELGKVTLKEMFRMQDEGRRDDLQQALVGDAMRSYAMAFPEAGIFLVDTYDPLRGLENAITVIKELRELGHGQNYGVRFDSGDIAQYSKVALRRFAEEGWVAGVEPKDVAAMTDAQLLKHADKCTVFCAAADGIDEYTAKDMRGNGAFFRSWGIGTAGSHPPPMGLVYKAASVYMDVLDGRPLPENAEMTPVMKVASNAPVKSSNPGKINARRYYDESGRVSHTVVYDENLGLSQDGARVNLRDFADTRAGVAGQARDILVPVFDKDGTYVYAHAPKQKETFPGSGTFTTDLADLTETVHRQLETLPEGARRVERPKEQVLHSLLAKAFSEAKKKGDEFLSVNVKDIEAQLPPETLHIPVYLDRNLFTQRAACEQKHLGHANGTGVANYTERFTMS